VVGFAPRHTASRERCASPFWRFGECAASVGSI